MGCEMEEVSPHVDGRVLEWPDNYKYGRKANLNGLNTASGAVNPRIFQVTMVAG